MLAFSRSLLFECLDDSNESLARDKDVAFTSSKLRVNPHSTALQRQLAVYKQACAMCESERLAYLAWEKTKEKQLEKKLSKRRTALGSLKERAKGALGASGTKLRGAEAAVCLKRKILDGTLKDRELAKKNYVKTRRRYLRWEEEHIGEFYSEHDVNEEGKGEERGEKVDPQQHTEWDAWTDNDISIARHRKRGNNENEVDALVREADELLARGELVDVSLNANIRSAPKNCATKSVTAFFQSPDRFTNFGKENTPSITI